MSVREFYCCQCGKDVRTCDCVQNFCNSPEQTQVHGELRCERPLHHKGKCAARLPNWGATYYYMWGDSTDNIIEDLGIKKAGT